MAPTLWYTTFSPPVRCVLMTAKEIGLELELKPLDLMKGEQFSAEFKKINPQHTVPTLVDDDFTLWDSHAIATFMINKYAENDSLYPKDIYKRAKVDQRLHFDSSVVSPIRKEIFEKIALQGVKAIPETLRKKLLEVYDFAEAFLEDGEFIYGNTLTVADFSFTTNMLSLIEVVNMEPGRHAKLIEYFERMKKVPYFEEINLRGVAQISSTLVTKVADETDTKEDEKPAAEENTKTEE